VAGVRGWVEGWAVGRVGEVLLASGAPLQTSRETVNPTPTPTPTPPPPLPPARAAKLKGFEVPRAIHLEPHPFSVENGLMTPKLSLKRPQLLSRYRAEVRAPGWGLWWLW